MTRKKPARKPRKPAPFQFPSAQEWDRLIAAERAKPYSFKGGAYWTRDIGLLPVVEPYINTGGVCGYGVGIRASFLGAQAFIEWWKP